MFGTSYRSEAIAILSRDFPCTYMLWHWQEFGKTASSPVPVLLENSKNTCCLMVALTLWSWGLE